jgi:spore coat polysaccharide biosynthesis protein SpsF
MIAGIIQARMSSTRLPGKVMMQITNKTLLELCYRRLSHSRRVDKWIIATTENSADDVIEKFCVDHQIAFFRGSEEDVLDRYYQATLSLFPNCKTVVRICCDNPTHDGEVVDFCIAEFEKYGLDYFSNGNEPPHYSQDGITAEVFTFEALEEAWKKSNLTSEREHVTPYIKKSPLFKKGWRKFNDEFNFKLSVDNHNDFLINKVIFETLGEYFSIKDIINLMSENKAISQINANSIINEGYLKSLKEDKKLK